MKLKSILLVAPMLCFGVWCGYLATQQPKVWCDRQWAGLALYRGGCRSWTVSFCDGFAVFDDDIGPGHWEPFTFGGPEGIQRGYHRWPQFNHADIRGLLQSNRVPVIFTNSATKWPSLKLSSY